MQRALAVLGVAMLLPACGTAGAPAAGPPSPAAEVADLEDVTPLAPPLQVSLRYGAVPRGRLVLRTEWGPLAAVSADAPPLERRVEAEVQAEAIPRGLLAVVERETTLLARGESSRRSDDAGRIRAAVAPDGRLFQVEAEFDGVDLPAWDLRREHLLQNLVRHGRPAPFRRLLRPAGPGDVVAGRQTRDERTARAAALVALSPLIALLPPMPPGPVADGDAVTLMRRDFGTLFRRHPDLWTESRGRIAGLARHRGRRVLVVVADETAAVGPAPGWRLDSRGRGLLDLETGVYVEVRLDHVLTAPTVAETGERTKFVVRERLTLE